LLAYITYFIITVIIGFVEHAANLAAAGKTNYFVGNQVLVCCF